MTNSEWIEKLRAAAAMCQSQDDELDYKYWAAVAFDMLPKASAYIGQQADRIAELESQIIHQTGISACRIEERERMQKQIATLQEIAVELKAEEIYPYAMPTWDHLPEEDTWTDDKLFGKSKQVGKSTYRYHARDQLAKEHPEAFR